MLPSGAPGKTTFDTARLSEMARRHVQRHYADAHPETLEDLAQVTLLGFLEADRRETVKTPEAMIERIAQRVVAQHLRWLRRWRLLLLPIDPRVHDRPDPSSQPEQIGDPVERLRFTVLELFETLHAPCVELAREYFTETPWTRVAEQLGRSHLAVLQQWSRCVKRLREIARRDGNPLLEWSDE